LLGGQRGSLHAQRVLSGPCWLGTVHLELVGADAEHIAVAQHLVDDFLAVEKGSRRRVQVADHQARGGDGEDAVLRADARVRQPEIAAGGAADQGERRRQLPAQAALPAVLHDQFGTETHPRGPRR
jgi:hypothetical protein